MSNLGVIGALLWWRPPERALAKHLPVERFGSAVSAGFRYARHNPYLRATLIRSAAFFLFASAYWALLPLVARVQIAGGPELYGFLLGAIGAAAVAAAFALPWLKSKLGPNRLVVVAIGYGGRNGYVRARGESSNGAVSKRPRGRLLDRGLGEPERLCSGRLTRLGSRSWTCDIRDGVLWRTFGRQCDLGTDGRDGRIHYGTLPRRSGRPCQYTVDVALEAATGAEIDLTPSLSWPAPIITHEVEHDRGPVLVTVEYRIDPRERDQFLAALERLGQERRRDGAFAWRVFEDAAEEGRMVETFLVKSWLEHLRQHERVTNADRVLQNAVNRFHAAGAPKVTHLIASE